MKTLEWMQYAACAGQLGFYDAPARECVPVCEGCPARLACLAYALSLEEAEPLSSIAKDFGVYGGLTGRQRARLRNPGAKL